LKLFVSSSTNLLVPERGGKYKAWFYSTAALTQKKHRFSNPQAHDAWNTKTISELNNGDPLYTFMEYGGVDVQLQAFWILTKQP